MIDKIMTLWIGSGFGIPKKILGDNGGEFANEEYKDTCENLNTDVKHNPNLPMYYMTNHLHYTEQQLAKHLLNILTHYIKVDKHLLNQNHQEESVELYTIKFMLKIKFMKQEILFIIKEPKRKNGEGQEK